MKSKLSKRISRTMDPNPSEEKMSKGFYFAVVVICMSYLFVGGLVAKTHLKIEQQWSQELLDQNTHSMEIMGHQKKRINDLGCCIDGLLKKALKQQRDIENLTDIINGIAFPE